MKVIEVFDKWDIFSLKISSSISRLLYRAFKLSNYTLAYIFLCLYVPVCVINGFLRIFDGDFLYGIFTGAVNFGIVSFTVYSIREAREYSNRFHLPEGYRNSKTRFPRLIIFWVILVGVVSVIWNIFWYQLRESPSNYYESLSAGGFLINTFILGVVFMFISIQPPQHKRLY